MVQYTVSGTISIRVPSGRGCGSSLDELVGRGAAGSDENIPNY